MNSGLLLALVGGAGALCGAVFTGAVSLIAAALTRRHEQRRWLLDKLLEAYVEFNAAATAWMLAYMRVGVVTDSLNDDYLKLADATRRVQLLAPSRTADKTVEVFSVLGGMMGYFEEPGTATVSDHQAEIDSFASGLATVAEMQRDDLRGAARRRRAAWRRADSVMP